MVNAEYHTHGRTGRRERLPSLGFFRTSYYRVRSTVRLAQLPLSSG
jgi:hypothetical protein